MSSETFASPALASFWRIMAIARRHVYVLQRSPHRTFDVLVWPVVDVLLFGSIGVFAATRAQDGGQQVALYLMAGVVLWHVVYQAQIALATGFLEETWSRNVLNLMVTPMREWEYVAGVALFGLVKLVAGVGAVALIAWTAYAFVLRFGSGAEALAWGILFVIMPLSGVFYPVTALPAVLRPIAEALPTTHAFAVGRAYAAGEPTPWHEMGLAVLGTAGLCAVALAYLGWMLRIFRKRGYVTRYS
jgi:ABC-2 type transport system permease protein